MLLLSYSRRVQALLRRAHGEPAEAMGMHTYRDGSNLTLQDHALELPLR